MTDNAYIMEHATATTGEDYMTIEDAIFDLSSLASVKPHSMPVDIIDTGGNVKNYVLSFPSIESVIVIRLNEAAWLYSTRCDYEQSEPEILCIDLV